jgi:ribosomal protein S18 acetylase RimI-like enzyme
MADIRFRYTNLELSPAFNQTLDLVARERKYLANVTGFPLDRHQSFVSHIIGGNYAQYLALDQERVVGWCDALPLEYEGMRHVAVLGMGVLAEYRHEGIGSGLLELTLQHAKEKNNIQKIELEVFRSNNSALAFYLKHRFKVEGEKIKARWLDGRYDDLIVMGRFL